MFSFFWAPPCRVDPHVSTCRLTVRKEFDVSPDLLSWVYGSDVGTTMVNVDNGEKWLPVDKEENLCHLICREAGITCEFRRKEDR